MTMQVAHRQLARDRGTPVQRAHCSLYAAGSKSKIHTLVPRDLDRPRYIQPLAGTAPSYTPPRCSGS